MAAGSSTLDELAPGDGVFGFISVKQRQVR
jgi:hypothetical protein